MVELDIFKKFKLPHPVVCGLVLKITSPKGIRTYNEATQQYHYNLHTDLKQIYENNPVELDDGIYWVVDVAKTKELGMNWNHYLFIVEDDNISLEKSFLNKNSTAWIVDAVPILKKYFRKSQE